MNKFNKDFQNSPCQKKNLKKKAVWLVTRWLSKCAEPDHKDSEGHRSNSHHTMPSWLRPTTSVSGISCSTSRALCPALELAAKRASLDVVKKHLSPLRELFSCSVMSNSAITRTAANQASLSSTMPRSLLKFMSIESVIPSNHLILFCLILSCLQSFPASRSFLKSELFTSDGQSIGASTSASVLPMNIQGWFPLGLTGLNPILNVSLFT